MIWKVRIKQDQGWVSPGIVWGKSGEEEVSFSVCGAPLDYWANGGYVNILFTCGDCGFCSLGVGPILRNGLI